MLTLPIKKRWYDMILAGEKKEEYRDIKPYYKKRFQTIGLLNEEGSATFRTSDVVFRNGYAKESPEFMATVTLRKRGGRREWGAVQGKKYYVLLILEILEHRRNERIASRARKVEKAKKIVDELQDEKGE